MKKMKVLVLLSSLFFITLNNNADAQLFGKLREKLNGAASKQASKSNLDPTVSQGTYAKEWKDGTYSFWKRTSGGGFIDEYKAKLVFNRADDLSVTSFDFITDEYTAKFEADAKGKSDFIRFFTNKNDSYRAVFFKDVVVLLNTYNDEYGGKKGPYSFIENAKKYIEDSKSQQEADLLTYETNKKAAAAAEAKRLREKNGLHNKKVKSIAVVNVKCGNWGYGYYEPVHYNIEATLADGQKISTKNAGYLDDYIIKVNATLEGYSNNVKPNKFIDGDQVVIEVALKHNPAIKTTKKVTLDYKYDLTMSYPGSSGGADGHDFKVEVKQAKHAINGRDILLIRLTDLQGTHGVQMFKMDAEKTLYLKNYGQNGFNSNSGRGGDAGDGGNITVIKDPNVKYFNLDYDNEGGTGGDGYESWHEPGRDGRMGKFTETVRPVNF